MAPRVLELFSGTHSFGKWAEKKGYEVISLDILRTSKATHTCDILDFDYKQYAVGSFDIIWASPPCTQYSQARTSKKPRDLEGANKIVERTYQIIDYLKPRRACIENPQTGLLRKQAFMKDRPYMTLDYCQFSTLLDNFPYRKRTAIWSDVIKPNKKCDYKCDGILANPAKNGHVGTFCGKKNICLSKKHRVPQALFDYVLEGTYSSMPSPSAPSSLSPSPA